MRVPLKEGMPEPPTLLARNQIMDWGERRRKVGGDEDGEKWGKV